MASINGDDSIVNYKNYGTTMALSYSDFTPVPFSGATTETFYFYAPSYSFPGEFRERQEEVMEKEEKYSPYVIEDSERAIDI